MSSIETAFAAPGRAVHVRGAGPPLLLLGHFPEVPGSLDPLAEALAERFQVVRVEPLDRAGGPAGFEAIAGELGPAVAALAERAVVVGVGFGGTVAAHLAAAHPQAVRALVLVNAFYPGAHRVDRAVAKDLARGFAYVADLLSPELPAADAIALLTHFWEGEPGWAEAAPYHRGLYADAAFRRRALAAYRENFEWIPVGGTFDAEDETATSAFGRRTAAVRRGEPRRAVSPRDGGQPVLVKVPTLSIATGKPDLPEAASGHAVLSRFVERLRLLRWRDAAWGVQRTEPGRLATAIARFAADVDADVRPGVDEPKVPARERRDSEHIVSRYDSKIKEFRSEAIGEGRLALRGSHPKTHGVVEARFVVRPDLPEAFQVGVFAEPGRERSALLRFSSLGKPQLEVFHDRDPDVRGVGLKVLDDGPDGPETLMDVLVNTVPILSTRNGRDVVPQNLDFLKLEHLLKYADELDVPDVLEVSYYSQTPYRLGPDRAVKYRLCPRPLPAGAAAEAVDRAAPDFLRRQLEAALRHVEDDVVFDFMVQVQRDPVRDPIDDPRVEWGGPYVPVAEVRIPRQAVNDAANAARDEMVSFHLYHCPPAHAPLGAVNRSRRAVYDTSPHLRNSLNNLGKRAFSHRPPRQRVCVVGSGVAGMGAALALATHGHEVTVVEKQRRLGGHAISVLSEEGRSADPGFGSFTGAAYPNLLRLLQNLGIETESLGTFKEALRFFSLDGTYAYDRVEDLPVHRHVLEEAQRFDVWEILADESYDHVSARDYFAERGFSDAFIHWYFLGTVIFVFVGHPAEYYLDYPIRQLVKYSYLPVLLAGREPVLRVKAGSGAYMERFRAHLEGLGVRFRPLTRATVLERDRRHVRVAFEGEGAREEATFDALVLAAPPSGALEVLGDRATPEETEVLGGFPVTQDTAVIHHDRRFLPAAQPGRHANVIVPDPDEEVTRQRAFHFTKAAKCNVDRQHEVLVTYAYNRRLDIQAPRSVTLTHVKVTPEVVRLRKRVEAMQGTDSTWYCGSWLRAFTLHEDGLVTGIKAANGVMAGLQEYPLLEPHDFSGRKQRTPWGEDQTIIDVLAYQAAARPRKVAFTFVDEAGAETSLTYAALLRRAEVVASHLLHKWGARPGDRVLVVQLPGLDFLVSFFGAILAGVVPVPIYPPDPSNLKYDLGKVRAIVDVSGARLALSGTTYRRATRLGTLLSPTALFSWPRELTWHTTDDLPDTLPAPLAPAARTRDDLAFLQFTSGSTAAPRGVMITHGNLMHQMSIAAEALGFSPETVGACWVPPYHDLGLVGGFLNTVYSGCTYVFTSPLSFLKDPAIWGELITKHKATATASPDFGYRLLVRRTTPEQRARWDFSHLKVVMSAGEPVHYDTLRDFVAAFEPCGLDRRAFVPAYGLAEHVVAVSMNGARLLHLDKGELQLHHRVRFGSHRVVGCGTPPPSVHVAIVDPATSRRAADGDVGEIWVSSPSKARGYWGRPEETQAVFEAVLEGDAHRTWLRTGDLGFLHGGEVFVTGRLKDLIILRGRNIYPSDIERTAEAASDALRPGCAAAFVVGEGEGERLVVCVETRRSLSAKDGRAVSAAVRRAVLKSEGVRVAEVVLLKDRTIPKTTSGKVRRGACREAFGAGKLSVVARDARQESEAVALPGPAAPRAMDVESLLRDAIFEATRIEVDAERPLEDQLDLDSVGFLELLGVIRTRLAVDLPVTILTEHPTLRALSAYLKSRPDVKLPHRSVVPLSRGDEGDANAFVVVHPARGGVECFVEVARRWKEPLYALRQDEPAESVEALAARHIDALRSLDRTGPWLLGGYSFGATVALEMAGQLQAAGEEVAGVVALDEISEGPADLDRGPWRRELSLLLTVCRDVLGPDDLQEVEAVIRRRGGDVPLEEALSAIPDHELQATVAREVRHFVENVRLLGAYRPAARYAGPTALLRCHGSVLAEKGRYHKVIDVPGEHFTLLRPPHVDQVVASLEDVVGWMRRGAGEQA